MLEYTGHPLVDVGIATITAFAGKETPKSLTEADLDKVADYLITEYTRQPLKSFATVPFAGGAYFTQPAYKGKPIERIGTEKLLRAYNSDVPKSSERCVFTGKPAVAITLDEKDLAPGRAARSNIPLITGAKVINFHPHGNIGLLVSGEALLAIHAMPLGSAKSGGKLLMVHSDNKELMLHFAQEFLKRNRRAIQLAQQEGSTKLPEATYSYRTLLIDTLLPADIMRCEAKDNDEAFSITAYRLSNSGQDPSLEIYHLPMEILSFLKLMETATYNQQWHTIVNRAWEVEPQKKRKTKNNKPWHPRRNWLYEDLFDLPENASQFIRTYFLRMALRYAKNRDTDPRDSYSLYHESNLVSWDITDKFLERIMHMDKERIEAIKQLGDTLASYVNTQNDRQFFREFYTTSRYDYFRNTLIKANMAYTKQGHKPLVTFDAFVAIFEDGEDLARVDWQLARDLVLIRMVEQLYKLNWLGKNTDVLPDTDQETENSPA